jgi:hypothetical protein
MCVARPILSSGSHIVPEPRKPADPFAQHVAENAPVWKTYLHQAKAYDHDLAKILDSDLDSLLIFVSLAQHIAARSNI